MHHLEAERFEHVAQQLAIDGGVVHHQHLAPLAGVTGDVPWRRDIDRQLRIGNRRQEQADREARAYPSSLRTARSPPIRPVSIFEIVRPRPTPPAVGLPASAARSKGRKMRSRSPSAMPEPESSMSKM